MVLPEAATARRPVSLALRLTLLIGGAISLLLLALGWGIERAVEHHFAVQDAEELEVVAHSLQRAIDNMPPAADLAQKQARLAAAVQGHHGMYYMVTNAAGQTLFATKGPDLAVLSRTWRVAGQIDVQHLRTWQEPPGQFRGLLIQLTSHQPPNEVFRVVLAADMGFHEHFLAGFRQSIWLATSMAWLLAIFITWVAVHRGLRPLRDISDRISGISANQLHLRLQPQSVPIELKNLANAFNHMLERVEQDFRRLSNFSADIAHELRTPVTNLITQTQVLLSKERAPDAYKEVHYANLEEYDRMAKMIGDMLYLAQTDNRLIKPDLAEVDLAREVRDLFEYFEPWAEERQIRLRLIGQTAPVQGDRLMLRRAISNLLSNAIRYTPQGQAVSVVLTHEADRTLIRVENPGEPIAQEHLPHLFDRFYRVDPSRQRSGDGAGLGLAIVKSIVEAHAGTVSVSCTDGVIAFEMILSKLSER